MQLTKEHKQLFERVYKRHVSSMGMDARKKLGNVNDVKWDSQEKCLKVYFESGDWWHYYTNGTWS